MSQGVDKLLDWLREPQWAQWATSTITRKLVKMEAVEEMSILPDTEHGPMLQMVMRDGENVLFQQRLNLAAVDTLIGKLIRMRDHMAQMKGDAK